MRIRHATSDDLPALVTIYNQAVALRGATADLEPVDVDSRRDWFALHSPDDYPLWIAEIDGASVGWCSLSPWRPGRGALRGAAEISYYVADGNRGTGIGSALIRHAHAAAAELGFRILFALLLDVNRPSVALLEKFGYAEWGRLPGAVAIDGVVSDHLVYGRATG